MLICLLSLDGRLSTDDADQLIEPFNGYALEDEHCLRAIGVDRGHITIVADELKGNLLRGYSNCARYLLFFV